MNDVQKDARVLTPRLCIVNERGEYFTVRLTGGVVEPSWTPFRAHAYTYREETEAADIASRFGGTVRSFDEPSEKDPLCAVILPFVRRR